LQFPQGTDYAVITAPGEISGLALVPVSFNSLAFWVKFEKFPKNPHHLLWVDNGYIESYGVEIKKGRPGD